MADDKEKSDHKSEVEILATALAESNKNASVQNTTTVRVLGSLLAFSVLGNIALAGLQIKTSFFGQDIEMGNGAVEHMDEVMSDLEEPGVEEPVPPAEWCAEMVPSGEIPPEDDQLCRKLYPSLFE